MSELAKIEAMEAQEAEDNAEVGEDLQEVAVLDDASADMIIRQLSSAEKQYDRMKTWYDTQIGRLKGIRDRTRAWAEACLRPYMDMVPKTGKKIQSYDMESATLKLAQQDPEYSVNDEELVPWLEANGLSAFVVIEKKARWGDFKETLKDEKTKKLITVSEGDGGPIHVVTKDGEVIPGIIGYPRDPKFSIKCK